MVSMVALLAQKKVILLSKEKGMCYPFKDPPASLRTSESVVEDSLTEVECRNRVRGFHDVTPLAKLPLFDLVLGIVPDYIHGVLLGVTKQLLNLWLASSTFKKPWFIGHKIKAIDKRLKDMKPPDIIQRLPRQLETGRAYFKASELQAWLLYYSVPCLIDILPERYLQHFAYLVEGVYILLEDNITPDLLALARDLLSNFDKNHQALYGDSNCSLNVHNVGNCLVLPVLCYTDTAWGELSVESKRRLQRLQNRAARVIVRRDSTSEALKTLGWPNLETIRKRNKSILVFKCLNDLVPQYLSDYFNRNHSFHSYNTRPKLSLGKRTFRYSGAILFNSLPETYKRVASLEAFKRLMMKHDFA